MTEADVGSCFTGSEQQNSKNSKKSNFCFDVQTAETNSACPTPADSILYQMAPISRLVWKYMSYWNTMRIRRISIIKYIKNSSLDLFFHFLVF